MLRNIFGRSDGKFVAQVNQHPKDSLNLMITIPAGTNNATLNYNKAFILREEDTNQISRVKCVVDTSGIYNVLVTETVLVAGNPVIFQPGYYNTVDFENMLNVTIPLHGANSFHTLPGSDLMFSVGGAIMSLLGFTTLFVPAGMLSTNLVNLAGALDVINIATTLINTANELGPNYVTTLAIEPRMLGVTVVVSETLQKPIRQRDITTLYVGLFDRNGNPYITLIDITVIFTIDIYARVIEI